MVLLVLFHDTVKHVQGLPIEQEQLLSSTFSFQWLIPWKELSKWVVALRLPSWEADRP